MVNNSVILIGRLTRDPDVRYTNDQKAIARFTLAVDRKYSREGESTADFPPCIAFGRTAEFVEKYLKQGSKIAAEGRIQTGSYTNREGNKVYTTDVIVESVEFCDSKGSGDMEPRQNRNNRKPADDDFMQLPDGIDEELPFN